MEDKKKFWKGALCGALAMFLACMILVGTSFVIYFTRDRVVSRTTENKLKYIYQLIKSNYLYYDELDESKLQDAILRGYVEGLEEDYSVYYDAEETRSLFESTSGEFGGIGVTISQDINTMVASFVTIHKNAPGEEAGFLAGDQVYKVNGEDVTGMDLDSITAKIRGEVGTSVEITVLRGADMEEYTATVTRALIKNETVTYEMKEGKLGYMRVSGFEEVTVDQFKNALNDLTKQDMKGLVIDLRNNPGGNLDTVCEVLDFILPKGDIVSIKDRNGEGKTYTSDERHRLDVPLVVLINGYSASASEIFAGAVQDYGIGTLVGTSTYGKGIVQNIYKLPGGTALKITSSEYFTPKGRNIHGIGISPDVEVKYVYDEANPSADNQLEKALELLRK